MPLVFEIPQVTTPTVAAVDPLDLGGEDISMIGGTLGVTPNGDWVTVRGVDACRQSVYREHGTNPGVFIRRRDWGVGLPGLLFKGASASVRDTAISRSRTRLRANPRVRRIREVSGRLAQTGVVMTIRVDAVGGPLDIVDQVFKP